MSELDALEPIKKLHEAATETEKPIGLKKINAFDLLSMKLPEPRWAIKDLIPSGLTILGGRPKAGKSFMALDFCRAVSSGTYALNYQAIEGQCLYVALEDCSQRLQSRVKKLTAQSTHATALRNLDFVREFPRLNEGGLDLLRQEVKRNPDLRLIVIDTFQKVRPRITGNSNNTYAMDYDETGQLQRFALDSDIALVLIHHTKKAQSEYFLDDVSGSTGITASADCVMVLKRNFTGSMELNITGRDFPSKALAVKFNNDSLLWECEGNAEIAYQSDEQKEIIEILEEHPEGLKPKEIAEDLGISAETIRMRLSRMYHSGLIGKNKNVYSIKSDVTAVM